MTRVINGNEIDRVEIQGGGNPTMIYFKEGEPLAVFNIVINVPKVNDIGISIKQED